MVPHGAGQQGYSSCRCLRFRLGFAALCRMHYAHCVASMQETTIIEWTRPWYKQGFDLLGADGVSKRRSRWVDAIWQAQAEFPQVEMASATRVFSMPLWGDGNSCMRNGKS